MKRTQTETRTFCKFGVYKNPTAAELRILNLANEYRRELVQLNYEWHCAFIDFRNDHFPELYDAMVQWESAKARVSRIEREIKELHSIARDRNIVPKEMRRKLKDARNRRTDCGKVVAMKKKEFFAYLDEFNKHFKQAADWKNVNKLEVREELYRQLKFPKNLRPYAELWMDFDIRRRVIGKKYHHAGLGFAIRGEIAEASQMKKSKTSPGIRYRYGRPPEVRPWTRLTTAFNAGGLPFQEAVKGTPSFQLTHMEGPYWIARQQLGTREKPCMVAYRFKMHKPIPPEAVLKRWTLFIEHWNSFQRLRDGRNVKRDHWNLCALPTLSHISFDKPIGKGPLKYSLHWVEEPEGIKVAEFRSRHVNEDLVLPWRIIERRLALNAEQTLADRAANRFLEKERGVPVTGDKRRPAGMKALRIFVESHPDDIKAAESYWDMIYALQQAKETTQRAVRCIEKIYETVADRMGRLHDSVIPLDVDLSQIKRYDTRDLLKRSLDQDSRMRLHMVAPGKLRESVEGRLPAAEPVEVECREDVTDVFTSWVESLCRKPLENIDVNEELDNDCESAVSLAVQGQ